MTRAVLIILAFCVSGCAGGDIGAPVPDSYRDIVSSMLRSSLKDPYSVRDAQISAPSPLVGGAQGVCVRFNAKNSYGAYTGIDTKAFVFRGGKAIEVMTFSCAGLSYSPFPEMEGGSPN